jgi:aminoglycoside phosphotransferase (APT) family kinase protein
VTIPAEVAAAWGWRVDAIAPLAGGLINQTYVVGDRIAVLQRLHPVFGGPVNLDLEAVTAHLAAKGMPTPRLVRTTDDRAWVEHDGRVWRALTWVEGESVHAVPAAAWAEAGGALVGRFHRAVADLVHDYKFVRAGVHDTAAHLGTLRDRALASDDAEAVAMSRAVLDAASALPVLPATPRRHIHGDLKISNLMFRREPIGDRASGSIDATCLVDLDTLGLGTIAFELGDAMRSWCNPRGEDAGSVTFELAIFEAAMRGFTAVAGHLVSRDERASIVIGLETVCIELAARFAVDLFEDRYWGWDPARFSSRRAHNLVRAEGQLALGLAVRAARDDAMAIVLA